MSQSHIEKRIPDFSNLGFRPFDKTRFVWDLLIPRPASKERAQTYDLLISHIDQYIQLMIKMSDSLNDESLNQVKNIGLTEDFCMLMIRKKQVHPKLKNSLLKMFMRLHMSTQQKAGLGEFHTFCYENLNKINITHCSLQAMQLNKSEAIDFSEKRKLEEICSRLLNGGCLPEVGVILGSFDENQELAKDYLSLIASICQFIKNSIELGFTDSRQNSRILSALQQILTAMVLGFEDPKTPSDRPWYALVIDKARRHKHYDLQLKDLALLVFDILLLMQILKTDVQVLAYLRYFRESYDKTRKFVPSLSFMQSLFEMYDFNLDESLKKDKQEEAEGMLAGLLNLNFKMIPGKNEKINQVSPASKDKETKKLTELETDIAELRSFKYPFIDLAIRLYYSIASTFLACDAIKLSDVAQLNGQLQAKIIALLKNHFNQSSLFDGKIRKALMFVGREEYFILKGFDSDSKIQSEQVVSVNRLKEKISQILLDDITIQNQLQTISNNDNKLRRILEFTNIINKILSKFSERLFAPSSFKKTQDLLRVLDFHIILIEVFKGNFKEERHRMMLHKTLRFFEYFMSANPENTLAVVPFIQTFISMVDFGLPTSKVLSMLFLVIGSARMKLPIIKNIFEKIYVLAEQADLFAHASTQNGRMLSSLDLHYSGRDKLIQYFRMARNLLVTVEAGVTTVQSKLQRMTVERILYCYALTKHLLPSQLEVLTTIEVKKELLLPESKANGLLCLFREYFSLVNLAVVDNSDSMLVVISLLDQISLKTLILCEDLHPLLRVQIVGCFPNKASTLHSGVRIPQS